MIAGINAALFVGGRESFRLDRNESYIGVLIDDLITQGVDEPYRIFTSRAENRLSLRHDNADSRLRPYGRRLGLVGDADWEQFNSKRDRIARLDAALESTRIKRADPAYAALCAATGGDLGDGLSLSQLSKRPGITVDMIRKLLPGEVSSDASDSELESALANSLYAGYIEAQRTVTERVHHHDALRIPEGMDFKNLNGLSHEMIERLERASPVTFGQAKRIPGMTAAALSTLLVQLNLPKKAA